MSDRYNLLVIGSGGREHAIIKSLAKSPHAGTIFCAPGNGGIEADARCVDISAHKDVVAFCKQENIDLVVIGPEQPLVDGLADLLRAHDVLVFGPNSAAAKLEASKAFTKEVCKAANIPTAAYEAFTDEQHALDYVNDVPCPIVVKADGLAAGKGVIICETQDAAREAIHDIFGGKFGAAGEKVVIEAFLQGEELSFFALCDGARAVPFGSAQDHKAAYDGDKGPNTGGMGTYSPAPVMTDVLEQRIMNEIVHPLMQEMQQRGTPYQGILFVGLMIDKGAPSLIEFNVRLGDPETQSILTRLQDDLLLLLRDAAQGKLPDAALSFSTDAAVCVVMASKGYPGSYTKNTVIKNLDVASSIDNVTIYHAGTAKDGDHADHYRATGGRVLGVTGQGSTVKAAQETAYQAVKAVDWPEGYYRTDIAWRAIKRT